MNYANIKEYNDAYAGLYILSCQSALWKTLVGVETTINKQLRTKDPSSKILRQAFDLLTLSQDDIDNFNKAFQQKRNALTMNLETYGRGKHHQDKCNLAKDTTKKLKDIHEDSFLGQCSAVLEILLNAQARHSEILKRNNITSSELGKLFDDRIKEFRTLLTSYDLSHDGDILRTLKKHQASQSIENQLIPQNV